jgi:RNA polymerase sigma-70 factor, ECF subfamily
MLRVARVHVRTHASAEEVVQEAWLAVVRGLEVAGGKATDQTP